MKRKIYILALTTILLLSTTKCSHWIHNRNHLYPEDNAWNMGIGAINPQLPLDNKPDFIIRDFWVDVKTFLPKGYVRDGSVDYSKQFQKP